MQSDSVAATALNLTNNETEDLCNFLELKKNNDTFYLQCKCGAIDKGIK